MVHGMIRELRVSLTCFRTLIQLRLEQLLAIVRASFPPGTGWSKLYIVLIHTLSFLQLVNTNVSIYKIDLKSLVFRPVCDHARRACANLFGVVFTHINV